MTKCRFSILLAPLLCALALASCEKEDPNPIPTSEVYLKTPYEDYVKLRNPGTYHVYTRDGSIYPAGTKLGFAGVVVFRDLENKIRAADIACPVEANRNIMVDIKMPYAICPECGSKFDLSYGFCNPVSGESKHTLYIYDHASDRGSYILVTN